MGKAVPMDSRGLFNKIAHWAMLSLWPTQRMLWTREGILYILIWLGLLVIGLSQQINLILLVAGLAAGPIVASIFASAAMLRRLRVMRRVPPYVFSGEPLLLDYTLENDRKWMAALPLLIEYALVPLDRLVSGPRSVPPRLFSSRVPGGGRARLRGVGPSPRRG